ncbi:MAG: spore germination protein GerW family protein [Eubacteriales bacterium]|nr:spore germination protein GerW family protein [Eubacteriales bacterium]
MENQFSDIIGTSLEKIKEFADAETVIGEPISTPNGTTVIPVSKVSMGFASGGIGAKEKENKEKGKEPRIGGGGGTGVTVTPIAFLVISPSGKVDLLSVSTPANEGTIDKITSIIERSPDILERIKKVFSSDKKKKKVKVENKTEAADDSEQEIEVEIVEQK